MVQGVKFKSKGSSSTNKAKDKRKAALKSTPKRGHRVIPAKEKALVLKDKLAKKLTANINRNCEQSFATKANSLGRLTLLKPLALSGAKDAKEKAKKKKF